MYLRFGIALMMTVAGFGASAQRDSVLLKPVTIYGLPEARYLAGSGIYRVDSILLADQQSRHLGEILSFQFPIYFRNYGNGMLSGISMRGTSPQHVAVRWNGININSFSLGQSDFSMLPGVAFDDVKVHVGGGSARFGSGAFGGTVLLSSGNDQRNTFSLQQEVASFGRYFTSLKGNIEAGRLSSSSSLYLLKSKNDFPVPGSNERQPHAAFQQQGFVQHLEYNFSSSKKVELNYWFHDSDRDIQPTIGSQNDSDTQADRNHRLTVTYAQNNVYGLSKLTAGMVDDVIVYNGSKAEVFRWIGLVSHQYTFQNNLNISFGTEWNHIIAKMEEYGDKVAEDRTDLCGSLQKDIGRLSLAMNVRQPFVTGLTAPLLPYIGADIELLSHEASHLTLSANASKNFRAPTLNDRYWLGAGRENLNPETSYAGEFGANYSSRSVKINASAFGQRIEDWIQWVPQANGLYRPENVKQVSISGIESSAEVFFALGKYTLRGKAGYQFTRSITKKTAAVDQSAVGKQLIYTPVDAASASVMSTYQTWSSALYVQYSGKRFTEASNSGIYELGPFALVDFSVGKSWVIHRHILAFNFLVKNLFNKTYQLYSGRAMPGRNYSLKISYQLTQKKK